MEQRSEHRPLYLLIGLAVLVNLSSLFIPLIDPDAGVYASISKTMVQRNDFVNLWFMEHDWLDKPHLPFWITAISFKLFGFHDWAYKLPAVLFVFMGAWYTYLFAKKYYNKTVGLWAAFILLSALHIIISNNDVRAEPYLTGMIIASLYHFSNALEKSLSWQLVLGCLFAGLSIMTKGVFTLIPIGGAIAGHLLITKNWTQLFHWKWLIAAVLLVFFISPELYCLWKQFDQHPEKEVLGNSGMSGIKFFLWDSQFGRFFNTGPIKGKGDKLFFIHTLLWAFLPWALIMYAAIFRRIRNGIKKIASPEWFTVCGSLLTLLVFSFSGFQLPHYSNIIFPLLAILSADLILKLAEKANKAFASIQNILSLLVIIAMVALAILYKAPVTYFLIAASVLIILFLFAHRSLPKQRTAPYVRTGLVILLVSLYLNLSFYPDLLRYQSGNLAAHYINKNHPGEAVARIGIYFPSGEFYLDQPTWRTDIPAIASGQFTKARILFLTEDEKKELEQNKVAFAVLNEFDEFHISVLDLKFINKKTREEELKKHYVIRLL